MNPPLPELYEAMLDEATLAVLLDDITRCGEIRGVQVRIAGRSNLEQTWSEAEQLFRTGAAHSLQASYRHGGETWRDTLLRTPAGIRLVRMRVEAPS